MGNNQSSPSHNNRLSKPKTNTNSPGPIPVPAYVAESPVSVSSRYADLSAKGRQQIKETLLSPVDTEHNTAVWSNKDEDAVGELASRARGRSSSIVSRSNSRANSRSNSLSCFGSRQGSTTKLTELHHGSKISLVSNNTQVDLETAIRLLQEVKKNASPEDLAALHEALESSTDASPVPMTGQDLSRRISLVDGTCSSLTRRRSLVQTPGVATRTSPVDNRRKTWNSWKAPHVAPEGDAKWAVSLKGITPINRAGTLGTTEEGRTMPAQRAQTPGEMDYSHLGGLKLGTLSIVNGAPSPAPSAKIVKQKSRLLEEHDYFSAAEAEASPLMMKSTRPRGHVKSRSSVLPATTPLYEGVERPQKDPAALPVFGPNTPAHESRPILSLHTQAGSQQVTSRRIPSAYPITEHPGLEVAHPPAATNAVIGMPKYDASKYAQDYQAYIPYSPFANATTFSRGEEDEDVLPRTMDYKEEAVRILTGTIFDAPTTAIETSGSSLFTATPPASVPQQQVTKQRPAPRTADSGYSSGGSLRTGSRSRQSATSTTSPKPGRNIADYDGSYESASVAESIELAAPQASEAKVHRQSLKLQILGRPSRSPDTILSPSSTHSVASRSSADSSSSAQRRLQKRRPSQAELPVVQSCQSISENIIPDIPNNLRANFTQRLSHTPGMECLTHTYPTKDHVTNTEAVNDATVYAPVTQLTELEPERPPTPPAHGRRRSLTLFRRKSYVGNADAHKEDTDASPCVIDLGSIASSLGSSPYDAAMSRPLRKSDASPTHPHQLGAALPRAKSMVNMDSQAAAEFARMRSKDRALVEQERPQQRRRSYYNLNMEVGEAKASKRRPHSALHDIPPVPAIDSSLLKAPLSARPRLESHSEQKSDLSFGTGLHAKGLLVSQHVARRESTQVVVPQHSLDWDAHARHWKQRRKSVGEGLRVHAGFSEASASTVNSRNAPRSREDMASWGRYSGGLEYNYEGRGHISGSAGTRQLHSAASSKSMKWRNDYGVDLSDVPIMLQRA